MLNTQSIAINLVSGLLHFIYALLMIHKCADSKRLCSINGNMAQIWAKGNQHLQTSFLSGLKGFPNLIVCCSSYKIC